MKVTLFSAIRGLHRDLPSSTSSFDNSGGRFDLHNNVIGVAQNSDQRRPHFSLDIGPTNPPGVTSLMGGSMRFFLPAGLIVPAMWFFPPFGTVCSAVMMGLSRKHACESIQDAEDGVVSNLSVPNSRNDHILLQNGVEIGIPLMIAVILYQFFNEDWVNEQDKFVLDGKSNIEGQRFVISLHAMLSLWTVSKLFRLIKDLSTKASSFDVFSNMPAFQKLRMMICSNSGPDHLDGTLQSLFKERDKKVLDLLYISSCMMAFFQQGLLHLRYSLGVIFKKCLLNVVKIRIFNNIFLLKIH
tara:strand:+ start:10236 stop:11129 length:894 start_codon:yes stop_codon:yes gene_type:complete